MKPTRVLPSCARVLRELDVLGREAEHRYVLRNLSQAQQRALVRELLVHAIFARSARTSWARAADAEVRRWSVRKGPGALPW